MVRRLFALLVAVALASAANTGCGTIMGHSGPQPINVHLNPDEKATVFRDQIKVGDGSGTYEVDPKAEYHKFDVKTSDGREGHGGVQREIMPMVVVADAFMLLFPILIDYFDGGMWSWKSDLPINLGKAPEVQPQPTDTIQPRPNNTSTNVEMKPCPNCAEPRAVNSETCPHCGLK